MFILIRCRRDTARGPDEAMLAGKKRDPEGQKRAPHGDYAGNFPWYSAVPVKPGARRPARFENLGEGASKNEISPDESRRLALADSPLAPNAELRTARAGRAARRRSPAADQAKRGACRRRWPEAPQQRGTGPVVGARRRSTVRTGIGSRRWSPRRSARNIDPKNSQKPRQTGHKTINDRRKVVLRQQDIWLGNRRPRQSCSTRARRSSACVKPRPKGKRQRQHATSKRARKERIFYLLFCNCLEGVF